MGVRLHWFLPTHGDGRSVVDSAWVSPIGSANVSREPDIDYLAQVAQAAEGLGFTGMLTPTGSDFTGEHYAVSDARAFTTPDPVPPLYFGGSSDAGLRVAARRADVHLTWGELPDAVGEKIAKLRKYALEEGRELRFGIRLHVITQDTSAQAWEQAQSIHDQIDPAAVAASQRRFAAGDSEGQRRMAALHGGEIGSSARSLEIYPNLWAGIGLVRGGAGTALVGSHTEVADLIEQYHALGIEEFVLSGYPHLEEAFWFGEGVRPELHRRGLVAP
jgi:alkanesulfonate monooxygenase